MTADNTSFREEFERLEEIVRTLEDKDLDLDEALTLFEEGVGRLKSARSLLKESEVRVKRVLEDADGTLTTDDIDD
jgi:exodeoxyribonuclease VII small subunit